MIAIEVLDALTAAVQKAGYGVGEVERFREVVDWSRETQTGDRAELTFLPEKIGRAHV